MKTLTLTLDHTPGQPDSGDSHEVPAVEITTPDGDRYSLRYVEDYSGQSAPGALELRLIEPGDSRAHSVGLMLVLRGGNTVEARPEPRKHQ